METTLHDENSTLCVCVCVGGGGGKVLSRMGRLTTTVPFIGFDRL